MLCMVMMKICIMAIVVVIRCDGGQSKMQCGNVGKW